MKIDEWCQLYDITKVSYYWRLRKVHEAYLETANHTQAFVEVPSSAIHPVNTTSEHKITAVIRSGSNLTLEITDQASASLFLFCGKRTDRIKGLIWEGDGFLLLYKRIENVILPDSIQIADRFHLHQNLLEAIKNTVNSTIPVDIRIPNRV